MLILDTLKAEYIAQLYDVYMDAEPYYIYDYETFLVAMNQRQGYVIVDGALPIGAITFSDYIPGCDITIHAFVHPEYQKRWATKRQWYKIIFSYPFEILKLPRVSAYLPVPYYGHVESFLKKLGFKLEGIMRKKSKWLDGSYCDIAIYGLLKEEQRWR